MWYGKQWDNLCSISCCCQPCTQNVMLTFIPGVVCIVSIRTANTSLLLSFAASIPAVQGGSITKGLPGNRMHPDSSISHRGGSITQVSSDHWRPRPFLISEHTSEGNFPRLLFRTRTPSCLGAGGRQMPHSHRHECQIAAQNKTNRKLPEWI